MMETQLDLVSTPEARSDAPASSTKAKLLALLEGLSSLTWGWGIWTFVAGLFFGVLREKTGSLLAPCLAHGLPDAVGEPLRKLFGWM